MPEKSNPTCGLPSRQHAKADQLQRDRVQNGWHRSRRSVGGDGIEPRRSSDFRAQSPDPAPPLPPCSPARPQPLDAMTRDDLPAPLARFLRETCGVRVDLFQRLSGSQMPEPARRLLVHRRDMTTTLAKFHGSTLRVEVLRKQDFEGMYFREVFLRTVKGGRIAEYGVIAIALANFTPAQQGVIRAGRTPLGALLHDFKIPFVSSPIGFCSIPTGGLPEAYRALVNGGTTCFGRFNHLAKPSGEPLAWIVEILPLL
jgi:hypothetical protein